MGADPKTYRPRLTPAIAGWALADAVGMLILGSGANWLINGKALLIHGLPATTLQAVACIAIGLAVVFVSVVKLLVEVMHGARAASAPPPPDQD